MQPNVISDWLDPRISFYLRLPKYAEGKPQRYALLGPAPDAIPR
jgi:hypothetical protein